MKTKNLICKVIKKKFDKDLSIIHSPSCSIKPIYNLCKLNAKQVIQNHLSKEDKYNFAFEELKNSLAYKQTIEKIEAYDISHISGNNAVASCVVYSKKGPLKKEYRLFNIPQDISGNDVGSLKHVIERRLKYYDDDKTKPNIVLIDGGKNQLNFSESVIKKSKFNDIMVISIVKGVNRVRATETILSKDGVIEFNKNSKSYLLLQEIRDESHRFAIQALRKKKRKTISKSELDSIKGIGIILKKRLLKKYKSIRNIKLANEQDLMTVDGISEKMAKIILKKLKC